VAPAKSCVRVGWGQASDPRRRDAGAAQHMGKTRTDVNRGGPLREVFDEVRFVRETAKMSGGCELGLDENVYPSCLERADNDAIPHHIRRHSAGHLRRPQREIRMPTSIRLWLKRGASAVVSVSALVLGAVTLVAQYSMTVNKDRLINAQNEPQNWLMMNGDYASTRYSKLSQINRTNVKDLRMVWALALGGMQDVGQNGPESELNPLIDNGFMYTSDGWGTLYKIDARNPNKGEFVWITDPGVAHQGNIPRSRGIALWEDLVIANLPDGRVIGVNRSNGEIVWDKKVAVANEFGSREKFFTAPITAEGKVIIVNSAGDGKTRGWIAALDARTGNELWRWYVVPKPGDPGSETWKDKNNAWKTGAGGIWQTGSYDPATR
jgi:glucose dehydrogenase